MLIINERTANGYPVNIDNDGVKIFVLAVTPAQLVQVVSHHYRANTHEGRDCPLCTWAIEQNERTQEKLA